MAQRVLFLAALFAVATVALLIEFFRNPITHAGHATATRSRGFVKDYATVLRSPWARAVIVAWASSRASSCSALSPLSVPICICASASVSRWSGSFVGAFAIGGLIYSLSVRGLVNRLGQIGLVTGGGVMLALAYLTIAFTPNAYLAPFAITAIGLGYYMLHNTLQTNATQMTPEARGTAVAIFPPRFTSGRRSASPSTESCSTASARCRCL